MLRNTNGSRKKKRDPTTQKRPHGVNKIGPFDLRRYNPLEYFVLCDIAQTYRINCDNVTAYALLWRNVNEGGVSE